MFHINQTLLLVIDVQGKLAQSVVEHGQFLRHLQMLIKGMQILDIPLIATEQVPEKLGPTIGQIQELLSGKPIKKTTFSCWGSPEFQTALKTSQRKQILISGIETHVCVYQTARDLLQQGFDVCIVADAVSSRQQTDKDIALAQCARMGIGLLSTEMIATELIGGADHPKFKDILNLIK